MYWCIFLAFTLPACSNFVPFFLLLSFLYTKIVCNRCTTLRITKIVVPEITDHRDVATLSCSYDMGSNALNSVKWYKDSSEFFRYAPMMSPTISRFSVDGVHLADQTFACNTITCSIQLHSLESRTSGSYRCEISGDAPEFKLASRTANMTIAGLKLFINQMYLWILFFRVCRFSYCPFSNAIPYIAFTNSQYIYSLSSSKIRSGY